MLSTKLWALLQRDKGRDLFDLAHALAYCALYKQEALLRLQQGAGRALQRLIYVERLQTIDNLLLNLLPLIGAGLIATGFVITRKDQPFPGWLALLPTCGAAMIIGGSASAWFNRGILSNRVLVWFGLISYPLYLWHWPILSFLRIVEARKTANEIRVMAVLIAIVLAWLTYYLIERPIRFGGHSGAKAVTLMLLMAVIGCAGYDCYERQGLLPMQMSMGKAITDQYKILADYNYFDGKSEEEFWGTHSCFLLSGDFRAFDANECGKEHYPGRPKIFLIGDSHSAYLAVGLREVFNKRKYNFYQYSAAHCAPLSLNDKRARCQDINLYVFDKIKAEHPDVVFISANYFYWADHDAYGEAKPYDDYLLDRIQDLKNVGIRRIFIIGQMPTWEDNLPKLLARKFLRQGKMIPSRTYEGIEPLSLAWDEKMKAKTYPQGVEYLSLRDFLCDETGCLTMVGGDLHKDLIVFDRGHLTSAGARYIGKRLILKVVE
jgi:hypothetical protein